MLLSMCRCVIANIEDLLSLAATIHELLDHRVISSCPFFSKCIHIKGSKCKSFLLEHLEGPQAY